METIEHVEIAFLIAVFIGILSILLTVEIPKEGQIHLDNLLERGIVYGMPPVEEDLEKFIDEKISASIRPLVNRNNLVSMVPDDYYEAKKKSIRQQVERQIRKIYSLDDEEGEGSTKIGQISQKGKSKKSSTALAKGKGKGRDNENSDDDDNGLVDDEFEGFACDEYDLTQYSSPVYAVLFPQSDSFVTRTGMWLIKKREIDENKWEMAELVCHDPEEDLVVSNTNVGIVNKKDVVQVSKGSGAAAEIPKVLHIIWLGHYTPISKARESWLVDFAEAHKDWTIKLWDDRTSANFYLMDHDVYNSVFEVTTRVDILKYNILYRFGGAYVDADQVWMGKNINDYLKKGKKKLIVSKERDPFMCVGVMFAPPRHPVFLRTLRIIRTSMALFPKEGSWFKTGTTIFSLAFYGYSQFPTKDGSKIMNLLAEAAKGFNYEKSATIFPLNHLICNIWYDDWKNPRRIISLHEDDLQKCKKLGNSLSYDYSYTGNRMWQDDE